MKMKMEKMKILSVSLILSVKLRGSPNFVPFFVIGRKEGNGKGETRSKHISKESWSCKGREKGEGVSFPSTNFSRNEGRNSFKENLINDEDAPGLQTSCDIIEVATDATFECKILKIRTSRLNGEIRRDEKTKILIWIIFNKGCWNGVLVFEVWKYAFYRAIGSYLERFSVGPSSYDNSLRKYLVEAELLFLRRNWNSECSIIWKRGKLLIWYW